MVSFLTHAKTQLKAVAILRRGLGTGRLLRLLPKILRGKDPFAALPAPKDEAERASREQLRGAVQLYLALRGLLPDDEALALTKEVVIAATLEFLSAVLPRFDRAAYTALGDERESYLEKVTRPFVNSEREFHDVSAERFEMRVTACHFHRLCVELGLPELAPVFCAGDLEYFADPGRPVALTRETTLAADGVPCRFVFEWREAPGAQ